MALSAKLAMRQGQSMVLTPQLLQAIKLLQMPNAELAAFIEEELERNPLLERAEDAGRRAPIEAEPRRRRAEAPSRRPATGRARPSTPTGRAVAQSSAPRSTTPSTPTARATPAERRPATRARAFARPHGRASAAAAATSDGSPISRPMSPPARSLERIPDPAGDDRRRRSGRPDDRRRADRRARRGRLLHARSRTSPRGSARRVERVEAVLARLQGLEPTGVFARNLAECLKLQLIERDRFDPAMQAMIDNLPALAKRDLARAAPGLRRRRRRPLRHDRRDQAARSQTRPRLRRLGRADGDSRRVRHRRAGRRLARRAQQRGAAARAGQRDLRRQRQARRGARGGPAIRLDPAAERRTG